jgi:hypothetical protein
LLMLRAHHLQHFQTQNRVFEKIGEFLDFCDVCDLWAQIFQYVLIFSDFCVFLMLESIANAQHLQYFQQF